MNHIFCINPGRSGSKYLAELLGKAKNTAAFHEAHPLMIDEHLEAVTAKPMEASYENRLEKVQKIQSITESNTEIEFYIETNHMFIKTFYDVVCTELSNVTVLWLRRSLAETLKSFIELNYFTDRNIHWSRWMIRPDAVTAALPIPLPYKDMTQFQRCIAYLLDIEARGQRFQKEFEHIPIIPIRLEELKDIDFVNKLADNIQLDLSVTANDLVQAPKNNKNSIKQQHNNPTTLDECQYQIDAYLELLKSKGIQLI